MKYDKTVGCVDIHIDTKRIDDNLRRAQNKLDEQILNDMIPYMPFQQGYLTSHTYIVEPGMIKTDGPYAHYQYIGELYLTDNGRSFAYKGEKKYPTGLPLHQHQPGTTDHWFEAAKQAHCEQWIDLVKREVGKG